MKNNFDTDLLLRKEFKELSLLEKEFILKEFTEEEFRSAQRLIKSVRQSFEYGAEINFSYTASKTELLSHYKQHHKKSDSAPFPFFNINLRPAMMGAVGLILIMGMALFITHPEEQATTQVKKRVLKDSVIGTTNVIFKKPKSIINIKKSSQMSSLQEPLRKHQSSGTNSDESFGEDALCYSLGIDSAIALNEDTPPGLYTEAPQNTSPAYNQP